MDKQDVPPFLLLLQWVWKKMSVFFKALNNNMLRIKGVSAKGISDSSCEFEVNRFRLAHRRRDHIATPIKSHVLKVEHLSIFFKCQDTETDQTAPSGVENRLHKSAVHASSLWMLREFHVRKDIMILVCQAVIGSLLTFNSAPPGCSHTSVKHRV